MVHYMANHHASQEAHEPLEQPQQPPDLMAELEAMQTIATALTGLRDEQARIRVLRWADCFSAGPGAQPSPPAAQPTALEPAMQSRRHDTTLTLVGYDLFGDTPSIETAEMTPRTAEDETAEMTPRTAEEPLDLMIKGLVADFKQIARDWHGE
jgi:hypothetical protein